MAAAIAPGSRVVGLRRLGGGLGAAMHRFDLILPDGERRKLVLRRYPRLALEEEPDLTLHAWRTLELLERLEVAAPRAVWADFESRYFGTQALVMTRLPGRTVLLPRDRDAWLRELGAALARLHRTRLDGVDLSFLRGAEDSLDERFGPALRDEAGGDRLGARLQAALRAWRPRLRRMQPVLCHTDFWPGNTLWLRGRVSAIVDWDDARLCYPGFDVGYCRMDLALQHGEGVADVFLHAYEAAAGMRIPQLHVWDLLGASAALPDVERWLPGYHELGRRDMTPVMVRERLAAFIESALARAEP